MSEDKHIDTLGKESVHGIKNSWLGVDWPTVKVEEPKSEPIPKPEVKVDKKKVRIFDRELAKSMATWLRKRDGITFDQAMEKIENDPSLYEELKNLKKW